MIFTKDKNGKSKLNGFFWILIICGAIIYIIMAKQSKTVKDEVVKNPGGMDRSRSESVTIEEASPELIKERDKKLKHAEEISSSLDKEANNKHKKEIGEGFDHKKDIEARGDAISMNDVRLQKFLNQGKTTEEAKRAVIVEELKKREGWIPFSQRVAEEQLQVSSSGNQMSFKQTEVEEDIVEQHIKLSNKDNNTNSAIRKNIFFDEGDTNLNFLPRGTYIPVVLLEDVRTTDLRQMVSVLVADDVYFRKQLQLPKGAVKIQGYASLSPTQDSVDIIFDNMLFADGTELPIAAVACNGMSPLHPKSFKTRGIKGNLVTPPFYVQAKSAYYQALLSGGTNYLADTSRNYNQSNINGDGNTVDTNNTLSGSEITKRALVAGTVKMLEKRQETALEDMSKYRPYVEVQKGAAFFVQLQETTNLKARTINGVAKASLVQAKAINNKSALPGIAPGITGNTVITNGNPTATSNTSLSDKLLLNEIKALEEAAATHRANQQNKIRR